MKSYSESEQTRKLCKSLEGFGWRCLVLAGSKYGTPGLPDRLMCLPDRQYSVFVEFKLGTGKLSNHQTLVCETLAASGLAVAVVSHARVEVGKPWRKNWKGVVRWVGGCSRDSSIEVDSLLRLSDVLYGGK